MRSLGESAPIFFFLISLEECATEELAEEMHAFSMSAESHCASLSKEDVDMAKRDEEKPGEFIRRRVSRRLKQAPKCSHSFRGNMISASNRNDENILTGLS